MRPADDLVLTDIWQSGFYTCLIYIQLHACNDMRACYWVEKNNQLHLPEKGGQCYTKSPITSYVGHIWANTMYISLIHCAGKMYWGDQDLEIAIS